MRKVLQHLTMLKCLYRGVSKRKKRPRSVFHHSHKKRKDNLETRVVHIKCLTICWNSPNKPKHLESFFKNMACTKGNQLFLVDFHAILDKIETDMLQITKKWNWKWTF